MCLDGEVKSCVDELFLDILLQLILVRANMCVWILKKQKISIEHFLITIE